MCSLFHHLDIETHGETVFLMCFDGVDVFLH